jgi:hypothetical protein
MNGSVSIGTGTLAGGVATLTTSFATAGTVAVQASYSGDANFTASTSAPLTETIVVPGFTATVNPSSLTIPRGNSGMVSLTLIPQGGFRGTVTFSCGTLPQYFSCTFAAQSATFTASGAPLTNKLTIHSAVVPAASAAVFGADPRGMLPALAFWLPAFAGLLATDRRKRHDGRVNRLWMLCLLCAWLGGIAVMSACGGGRHEAPDGTYSVPIVLQSPGLASRAINVTVIVQ